MRALDDSSIVGRFAGLDFEGARERIQLETVGFLPVGHLANLQILQGNNACERRRKKTRTMVEFVEKLDKLM